jgi:hypothetical protein
MNRGQKETPGRRVRNAIRVRYEQMITAVVRWGRALEAKRAAEAAGGQALAQAIVELEKAQEELLAVYRELS